MKNRIVIALAATLVSARIVGVQAQQTNAATRPNIQTVFIILMENHNWSQIKGSRYAPYINKPLLLEGSHAEQYFNPPAKGLSATSLGNGAAPKHSNSSNKAVL